MKGILQLFFILISISLFGQAKFTAATDARQIVSGQYFTISFTLENAKGSNFKAPSFLDFDVAGGPSTSSQISIINGRRSEQISYSYTLTSSKIGTYEIGSASIIVKNKELKTQPVTVEVVKGRTISQGQAEVEGQDFLIEAEIDYDTGYVGQQLILKYILYTNKNVRSYNFTHLPGFDGFFAQELQGYQSRAEQIVRDGVQYYKRVIRVIALFPQQRGSFTIDPAQITVGISDRSNNFFFNTRLKQYRVASTGLHIDIIESPDGAPLSFSGAIGDFYMGTAVDKKSIAMDDAITLTLQVRGFGDGKFIEAPKQPYTDLFDIYDPNLLEEKSEVIGDRIQTTKTYEYLMIPKKLGTIKFNPELSYYDLDSAKYITIYGQQYRVNVIKGSDRELADLENIVVELVPPPKVEDLYPIDQHFAYSWGHLGANGVLLIGFLGLFVARKVKDRRDNIDPAIKRNQRAKKLAVLKLSAAKLFLDQGDIKNYYIRLRQALQEYLADKTNQPTAQLSKNDIIKLLEDFHLTQHLEPLLVILQKGEQAIYASIAPGKESEDYIKSLEIVEQIESALD